ncbi:MAG: hypothetical protein MUF81_03445 [Verrucomicrobia bacterium]|jgi:hypothetical protein|nr:hypothetical protein [Verrucomicrobiota bacterium]
MNEPETKPATAPQAEDLKQQCVCLQRQMTTLLLALVIVSGTLSIFLWRQVRYARRDLEAMKPPATQMVQEFNQIRPGMDAFLAKVTEFGRTHADFAPILTKYRIPMTTGAPPATVAAPKPAAAKPAAAPASAPKK